MINVKVLIAHCNKIFISFGCGHQYTLSSRMPTIVPRCNNFALKQRLLANNLELNNAELGLYFLRITWGLQYDIFLKKEVHLLSFNHYVWQRFELVENTHKFDFSTYNNKRINIELVLCLKFGGPAIILNSLQVLLKPSINHFCSVAGNIFASRRGHYNHGQLFWRGDQASMQHCLLYSQESLKRHTVNMKKNA